MSILRGSLFFVADLIRAIDLPLEMDFLAISSYTQEHTQTGAKAIRFLKDLDQPLKDKNVLIVEDMIDSGLTLHYITRSLGLRRPLLAGDMHALRPPPPAPGGHGRALHRASKCPTTSSWATASTTASLFAIFRTWPTCGWAPTSRPCSSQPRTFVQPTRCWRPHAGAPIPP